MVKLFLHAITLTLYRFYIDRGPPFYDISACHNVVQENKKMKIVSIAVSRKKGTTKKCVETADLIETTGLKTMPMQVTGTGN